MVAYWASSQRVPSMIRQLHRPVDLGGELLSRDHTALKTVGFRWVTLIQQKR
jgi:hypothetical protein